MTVPAPAAGPSVLSALNMLEGYSLTQNNPETVHRMIEVSHRPETVHKMFEGYLLTHNNLETVH